MWDETRDGTQVQLPKQVFTEYFGAALDTVTWIQLHAPDGEQHRIRLQGFPNATFRISLPFVGQAQRGDGRRAVLRFDRIDQDKYICAVAQRGDDRYSSWLSECDQQRKPARSGLASLPPARPLSLRFSND